MTHIVDMAQAPAVSATLRAIRVRLKLTQNQLAERLGVSFTTVDRWDRRANRLPKAAHEVIARVARDARVDTDGESDAPAADETRRSVNSSRPLSWAAVALLACVSCAADVTRRPPSKRVSLALEEDSSNPVSAPATGPKTGSKDEQGTSSRAVRWPAHSDVLGQESSTDVKQDEKNYLIPALEIVGFEVLLNQFDRQFANEDAYDSNLSTSEDNLHSGWVVDRDLFSVNQLQHPYAGSIYFGFARSAGLDFWESFGYTFAASALWEVAGETTPPSLNDQITTSIGGSFLGEALHRTSIWMLGDPGKTPEFVRELGAGIASPPTSFNRLLFGDRFRSTPPSVAPAVFSRIGAGAKTDVRVADQGVTDSHQRTDGLAEFAIDYGLPGKRDYRYTRPFDYFHFEVAATSNPDAIVERLTTRGLLFGEGYEVGHDYRGIWGLYGSYDYFSTGVFKVGSSALSIGTTGQARVSEQSALQISCLGGVGFGAAGTNADDEADRNYHYGAVPQALVDVRFILCDAVRLDLTGRDFYITGRGVNDSRHNENIAQAELGLMVRIWGRHALRLQFTASQRDADSLTGPGRNQSVESITLSYDFLAGDGLGIGR
jgi:transcriptional regulator with XRE-family HTH domain